MRHQRGFTLIEMLISLLLLSLAILVASRLLLETQSHLLHTSNQLLEPAAENAVQQIRADLRASSNISSSVVPGWSRDPLVLLGHPAGIVTYQKTGDELIRSIAGAGHGSKERLVLKHVTTWRWRPRGRSVEIDLGHRELGHLRQQSASGRWREPVRREIHRVFWVTPRAPAGGRRW